MIFLMKSFPKIRIILTFSLIFLCCCASEQSGPLDNEKFIEIYARLLIISEMDISKDHQDKLVGELYRDYSVSKAEIDTSIAYFNANPKEWAGILEKTRDKIQEIRKEIIKEEKQAQQTEEPVRAPLIRDTDKKDTRQRRLREKPAREKVHPREKKEDRRP